VSNGELWGQRTGKNTTSIGPDRIGGKHFSCRLGVGFYASSRDRKVTQKWDFRADPVCEGARARPGKKPGKSRLCVRGVADSRNSVRALRRRCEADERLHRSPTPVNSGERREGAAKPSRRRPRSGTQRKKADPQGARLLSRHCHPNSSIGEPIPRRLAAKAGEFLGRIATSCARTQQSVRRIFRPDECVCALLLLWRTSRPRHALLPCG
jgi:hypothetical protein